jgi:hypothetical protein
MIGREVTRALVLYVSGKKKYLRTAQNKLCDCQSLCTHRGPHVEFVLDTSARPVHNPSYCFSDRQFPTDRREHFPRTSTLP